jgi:ubiquinone/menaquinone biosynthesis C-methylase UbiE
MTEENKNKPVDLYNSTYSNYSTQIYHDVRSEFLDGDMGQSGWLSMSEQDMFISWLKLTPESLLLDVACGSGGTTLRVAAETGCKVHGIDIQESGIINARSLAEQRGLSDRAEFQQVDVSQPLPFESDTFDAITCIDSICHFPDRELVLNEWKRVLRPGGRVVFTDPIVITGPLTDEEIAIRSSIGFYLFVPPTVNEGLIENCGLALLQQENRTDNMAQMAQRWHDAREKRADALREIEGDETFSGQQKFFEVAARIAHDRRLSRFVYLAQKPE